MGYYSLYTTFWLGIPGGYTNVANYHQWIIDTVEKAERNKWLDAFALLIDVPRAIWHFKEAFHNDLINLKFWSYWQTC